MQFLPIDTEIFQTQIYWCSIVLCLMCIFCGYVVSRREFAIYAEIVLPGFFFLEFLCVRN